MQDRTSTAVQERHPQDNDNSVPVFAEELRRVVADAIGKRKPGIVYTPGGSDDVQLKVLAVTTDRDEARRLLGRRAAQFAITVLDVHTGHQDVICTVWTDRDRVLKAVA